MTDKKIFTIIVIVAIAIACVCVAFNSSGIHNIQGAQITSISRGLDKPYVQPDPSYLEDEDRIQIPSEGLFDRKKSNADMASKFLQRDAPFYELVCFNAAQSLVPMYGPEEFLDPTNLEFSVSDSVSLLCELDLKIIMDGLQQGDTEKAMEGVEVGVRIKLP